jgi:hypothetical protein
MATVSVLFERPSDQFDPIGTVFPQSVRFAGTNFPVEGLAFDAAADEACVAKFKAKNYGSGNITAILTWYGDSATSGVVRWGAAIAAITPESDTQDVETDSFATENTVDDTHLGTTAQRLHNATITISNLDSIAADDIVFLRLRRVGSNGSDTMTGDAILVAVELSYSDT